MDKFVYYNIHDFLDAYENKEDGENVLNNILSVFTCPKNLDVEKFLKKNSIDFAKKHQSITYLVLSSENGDLVGYFTLTLKPILVNAELATNKIKKKISRVSTLDEETKTYMPSAYLIAQLGKNFTDNLNEKITGKELLDLALKVIQDVKKEVGGVVTFLEAEKNAKVLNFYNKNGFKEFGERITERDGEKIPLVMLLKLI